MRSKRRGFTLVELMIVVALMGTIASLAIWGIRKNSLESEVSDLTNQFVQSVNMARRRAVATRAVYMLDVRASQMQWCAIDPASITGTTTSQLQCPSSTAGIEAGPLIKAKPGAIFRNYATAADAKLDTGSYAAPPKTAFAATKLLMFFGPNGTVADSYAHAATSGTVVPGFTVYAEPTYGTATFVTQKHERAIVLGPSGRTRVITQW